MTARDELEGCLWRLRGIAALAQLIHDDREGTPYLDDLLVGDRAAVLALMLDLADRAEKLCEAAGRDLECRP
jgi:hypothetical protein